MPNLLGSLNILNKAALWLLIIVLSVPSQEEVDAR